VLSVMIMMLAFVQGIEMPLDDSDDDDDDDDDDCEISCVLCTRSSGRTINGGRLFSGLFFVNIALNCTY